MTAKEKQVIEKLKALIKNTPYEGEKATALNVLKKYCAKHGVNFEDLEFDEEVRTFEYIVKEKIGRDYGLLDFFITIIEKHFDRKNEHRDINEVAEAYKIKSKNQYLFRLKLKTSDFFSIVAEYEFYSKHYVKEYEKQLVDYKKKYFRAFLTRHRLLLSATPNDNKPMTAKDRRMCMEADIMAEDIEKVDYFEQIEYRG